MNDPRKIYNNHFYKTTYTLDSSHPKFTETTTQIDTLSLDQIFKELTLDLLLSQVRGEVKTAIQNWPPFNSAHEGFSVLKEEVDELWDEVKIKQKDRQLTLMRKEALQVAAMAIRFALEVCNEETIRK